MGLRRGRTVEQKGGRENTSSDLWSLVLGSAVSRQALRFVYCVQSCYWKYYTTQGIGIGRSRYQISAHVL